MKYFKTVLLFTILTLACTPKVAKVIEEKPSETVNENVPCPAFNNLSSYKKELAENAFVLYKDYFGMGKYKEAFPYWRQAYTLAPGSNGSVKSHFDDGVTLYADLMSKSSDKELQQKYMDTINQIYAKREMCFPVDADYYGQKGFDYYYKLIEFVDEQTIYDTFKKSIDVGGGKVPYFIINPFTKVLYDKVNAGTVDNKEASGYSIKMMDAVKNGLATCTGKACESWNIINEYAPDLLGSLEGVDDFYDCNYYMDKYYALYLANPDDCEIINTALSRMLRGGCAENDVKVAEIKTAKESKCYTPPPPPGMLRQGYDAYQAGNYKLAVQQFDQYVLENDDPEKQAKYSLLIAKIYYGDIKNYPKAREYAKKAASYKPGWGDPYILIGKLYASSGPLCGPGRGWDSQVVTWPAIDMFQYAKNIDPAATSEANKWINTYTKYMPSKEDIFFRSIKAGSSYRVPCWIQENTIVRTSD